MTQVVKTAVPSMHNMIVMLMLLYECLEYEWIACLQCGKNRYFFSYCMKWKILFSSNLIFKSKTWYAHFFPSRSDCCSGYMFSKAQNRCVGKHIDYVSTFRSKHNLEIMYRIKKLSITNHWDIFFPNVRVS